MKLSMKPKPIIGIDEAIKSDFSCSRVGAAVGIALVGGGDVTGVVVGIENNFLDVVLKDFVELFLPVAEWNTLLHDGI